MTNTTGSCFPKCALFAHHAAHNADISFMAVRDNTEIELDTVDLRILRAVGRLAHNVELARRRSLALTLPRPCQARWSRWGVIDHYVAIANPHALGLGLNVFISISLKEQSQAALSAFESPHRRAR